MVTEKKSRKRILVVDDEPDFAVLASSILRDGGYDASTALSAEEAMARVEELNPDLVTLDLQMPHQSGLLFYRKLKTQPAFRNLPVVIVTGFTSGDVDRDKFVRHFLETDHLPHPEAYLEKPFERVELLRVVDEILVTAD
jgi:CheY-like chemotaxis protein